MLWIDSFDLLAVPTAGSRYFMKHLEIKDQDLKAGNWSGQIVFASVVCLLHNPASTVSPLITCPLQYSIFFLSVTAPTTFDTTTYCFVQLNRSWSDRQTWIVRQMLQSSGGSEEGCVPRNMAGPQMELNSNNYCPRPQSPSLAVSHRSHVAVLGFLEYGVNLVKKSFVSDLCVLFYIVRCRR